MAKQLLCVDNEIICSLEHGKRQQLVRPAKKSQLSFDIRDLVGVQIGRRRTEAGLSQQLLADQCGIFRTYLSRIENGTANPTIKVLASLAVALNADIGEMFKYGQKAHLSTRGLIYST